MAVPHKASYTPEMMKRDAMTSTDVCPLTPPQHCMQAVEHASPTKTFMMLPMSDEAREKINQYALKVLFEESHKKPSKVEKKRWVPPSEITMADLVSPAFKELDHAEQDYWFKKYTIQDNAKILEEQRIVTNKRPRL